MIIRHLQSHDLIATMWKQILHNVYGQVPNCHSNSFFAPYNAWFKRWWVYSFGGVSWRQLSGLRWHSVEIAHPVFILAVLNLIPSDTHCRINTTHPQSHSFPLELMIVLESESLLRIRMSQACLWNMKVKNTLMCISSAPVTFRQNTTHATQL